MLTCRIIATGKLVQVAKQDHIGGRMYYFCQTHNGYYIDPDDNGERYDSSLIDHDWYNEDQVKDVLDLSAEEFAGICFREAGKL